MSLDVQPLNEVAQLQGCGGGGGGAGGGVIGFGGGGGGEGGGGEGGGADERQMQWWNTSQCPLLCRLLKLRTMPAWLTQQPVGAEEET